MLHTITVVTLGPGDPSLLTLQAAEALKGARHLILRTARHGTARWLEEAGIPYSSFDALYDRYDDFDALHDAMASELLRHAEKAPLVYGVMDASTDGSVAALKRAIPETGKLHILAGISVSDACAAASPLPETAAGGLRVLPATACSQANPDPSMPMLITEIDSRTLAGEVKLWLNDLYDDETPLVFYPPAERAERRAASIPLMELDRQRKYDHTACVWVPAVPLMGRQRRCFADLVAVMARLRGEGGCPWDREQTHETLRKYLIEEAYEAAGAIDEGDPEHLADELGDVLLQIVFHADIGRQYGEFSITDVTSAICRKMIYRHAHIFGSTVCSSAEEVSVSWEKLKKTERGLSTQGDVLADVPRALPALMRTGKLQKKAGKYAAGRQTAEEILKAMPAKAESCAQLAAAGEPAAEAMGQLLFDAADAARLAGFEPEQLLQETADRFIRRYTAFEQLVTQDGKALEDLTLSEMDVYWSRVKTAGD